MCAERNTVIVGFYCNKFSIWFVCLSACSVCVSVPLSTYPHTHYLPTTFYSPPYLSTYLSTNPPTYLLCTFLSTYPPPYPLPTSLPTYLLTYPPTYIATTHPYLYYPPTYYLLATYLPTHLTYLPTHPPTHIPTYPPL